MFVVLAFVLFFFFRAGNINYPSDYEWLLAQPWLRHGTKLKVVEINELLDILPPSSSVSVTSPENLMRKKVLFLWCCCMFTSMFCCMSVACRLHVGCMVSFTDIYTHCVLYCSQVNCLHTKDAVHCAAKRPKSMCTKTCPTLTFPD